MNAHLTRLMLIIVALSFGSAALANEKARKDMLARDHQKCVLGCAMNNDGEVCQVLCDCTVDKFADLAFSDYVRLQIELNSDHVTDDHRAYLDDMALSCAAEVDAKFPELIEAPTVSSEGDGVTK